MKTEIRPENEMKDSGVEWIKHIPCDWDIVPLKRYFQFGKGLPITKADLQETGEKVISYGQIHAKFNTGVSVDDRLIRFVSSDYKLTNASSLCSKGDIILADTSEDKEGCGNAVYIDYDEKIFAGYHTITLKSDRNNKYLAYLFKSDSWREQIQKRVNGVKLFSITKKILNQCTIILPSSSEQQAIVDYLDEVCSKIDEIIAEARASIEEYTTYKQALIAETTTKGLNKNIEFLKTDFAWMGKIPAHWSLKPFKYVLSERNEKNNPIKSTERLSLSIDKGITLYAEKTTNLDRFKDDFTAYKLAYKGDLVMNSMNMIVGASGVCNYFGCVSPVYYTYFDNEPDHITTKYCEYLFRSRMLMRVLRSLGKGIHHIDRGDGRVNTCRLKVSRSDLRALVLPVPPLCEQRDIVNFLDKRTAEIDSLITEKEALIADLEAYKKSLIYELVTGKRRVV